MRLYCFNLVCPCFPLHEVYLHLIKSESKDSPHPTTSGGLSLLSCAMPSCLAANEAVRWCFMGSRELDEHQPTQQHTWTETAETALPILSMMHHGLFNRSQEAEEDLDTEFVERVEGNMQGLTCISVLMGATCIVPYVFLSRRAVQREMNHTPKESIWETGLISLFAWPCALTQIQEEFDMTIHDADADADE